MEVFWPFEAWGQNYWSSTGGLISIILILVNISSFQLAIIMCIEYLAQPNTLIWSFEPSCVLAQLLQEQFWLVSSTNRVLQWNLCYQSVIVWSPLIFQSIKVHLKQWFFHLQNFGEPFKKQTAVELPLVMPTAGTTAALQSFNPALGLQFASLIPTSKWQFQCTLFMW